MLKKIAKEQAAQVAAGVAADVAAAVEAIHENQEAERRANARKAKAHQLIMPTEQEDAAITAAALSDPDARPFTDAEWEVVKAKRRPGRPVQEVTKVATSLRLDPRVLNAFRATGDGWQTRMNDALLEYAVAHEMLHA